MMDPALFKLLVFINVIQVMNTFLNVIHKLKLIQGPNAHIAMAILSMISLAGYSGVLNTIFLKRRFHFGRILYMVVAMLAQAVILVLSILAFDNVMTYFQAIAIIHALVGFIIIINFTAAVLVVDEQQKELEDDRIDEQNKQLQRKIEVIEALTKRASIIPFHYESSEIHELQQSIQNLDFQLKKPKKNVASAEIEMMEMEKVMEKISEKDDISQSMEKSS